MARYCAAAASRIFLFSCGLLSLLHCDLAQSAGASTSPKTWVVCVSGLDIYKYTYGFEAGIYKTCHLLAGKKADPDNLIIISPDTAAYHVNNAVPGKVVHAQRAVDERSDNVYDKINVTYKSQDMTTKAFFGILSGDSSAVKGIGPEKVIESGPQDTIILVFINIGDYGVMTLTNNQLLYAEKLIPFFEDLKEKEAFKQMLILVDGHKAGSMFDGYLCTDCNIIALTNTAKQDDLVLCHYNSDVSAYTSTCYMYFFAQHLDQLLKSKEFKRTTLFDLYQQVKEKSWFLDSDSNLYGDLSMGNLRLSQFLNV